MDLGIKGKKAIVCASSRGLGRGCAMALAEAGCDLVVNGRDAKALAATASEIRDRFGVGVTEVARRRFAARDPGRAAGRLPLARHPGQQQWRPAAPRIPRPHPPDDPRRRHAEHDHADRAHQGGHRRHGRARLRPHRQHHLAVGLCADPRPRRLVRRTRRTDLVPGRRRADGGGAQRDDQQSAARQARHRPAARRLSRRTATRRRSRPSSPPTFRQGAWARPRSSARSAPSSAPSTPAISPARTSRSTAGYIQAHSDAAGVI